MDSGLILVHTTQLINVSLFALHLLCSISHVTLTICKSYTSWGKDIATTHRLKRYFKSVCRLKKDIKY